MGMLSKSFGDATSNLLVIVMPVMPPVAPMLACPPCEDYNGCTVDSCDTTTGTCRHDRLNCDDGNPCTIDTCDPSTGLCSHQPDNAFCDDGDEVTTDTCDPTCMPSNVFPPVFCDPTGCKHVGGGCGCS
jgi:hypothetical protein